MSRALALGALLLLAACATQVGDRAALIPLYRDPGVPISSQANFEAARFAGRWHEVARFPVLFEAGCEAVTADYAVIAEGRLSVLNQCRQPDGSVRAISGEAEVTGPGRLVVRLQGVPVAADYWVLWVDADYRTAVVGTPGGRAGWILNREPQISPDRLQAAREMLEFNGYDLSRLQLAGEPS